MSPTETAEMLRKWANVLDIPSGDFVNEDLRYAAAMIERMHADRLKLDRRIHNQRRSCGITWEIVEMRQRWIGSPAARNAYARLYKRYRELLAKSVSDA